MQLLELSSYTVLDLCKCTCMKIDLKWFIFFITYYFLTHFAPREDFKEVDCNIIRLVKDQSVRHTIRKIEYINSHKIHEIDYNVDKLISWDWFAR